MGINGPYRDPEELQVYWIVLDRGMVLRLADRHKPEFKTQATTPLGLPYKVLVAGEVELDWAVGHCLARLVGAGVPFLEIKVVCRPTLKAGLVPDRDGPTVAIIYYRHFQEIFLE